MGKPTIGLALSSGGARGSEHVGVLKVLDEQGLDPDIIVGTSMGAQVGGVYAAGVTVEAMEDHWRSVNFASACKTLLPTVPWSGWSSGRSLCRFLKSVVSDQQIEDLTIPFRAVATDLESGSAHVLDRGCLVEAIRASLSVPGLFTPVWIDGRLLIDGGVSNPMPVDVARDLAADVVIAVDVLVEPSEVRIAGIPSIARRERNLGIAALPECENRRFHPSVFAVLFQMSTVFQKRLCEMQLAAHPPDVLIRPDFSQDPPSYASVGCGIEAGEAAARAALPDIRRAMGVHNST